MPEWKLLQDLITESHHFRCHIIFKLIKSWQIRDEELIKRSDSVLDNMNKVKTQC